MKVLVWWHVFVNYHLKTKNHEVLLGLTVLPVVEWSEGDKKERHCSTEFLIKRETVLFQMCNGCIFIFEKNMSCRKIMSPTKPKKLQRNIYGLKKTKEGWPFPQQSPDLKAIKHLWKYLKHFLTFANLKCVPLLQQNEFTPKSKIV